MAKWIEQTAGKHVDAVRETVKTYWLDGITTQAAWNELSKLYDATHDDTFETWETFASKWQEQTQKRADCYIKSGAAARAVNSWPLGTDIAGLVHKHGGTFKVQYEY